MAFDIWVPIGVSNAVLIIIANVCRASDDAVDAVDAVGWAAALNWFPGDSFTTITTAGIAADAAATTATTAATAASTAAGATDTTAASSHVQAEAIALVWLNSGLNILGEYLCCSDCCWKLWGDKWSRVRDPSDIRIG